MLASKTDIAVQGHIHARANSRAINHGNSRFADERDIAVQLGEAVEEMLPGSIWPLRTVTIARQILALDRIGDIASHVSARAEATSDACEDNDPDVWIIVPSPHVFPHFGHCGVLFSRTDEGIHGLRAIELDPQDATILRLI